MLNKIAGFARKNYESDAIETYVSAALTSGVSAKEILDEGLAKGMDDIGRRFFFFWGVSCAGGFDGGNTMQAGMDPLIREGVGAPLAMTSRRGL